MTKKIMILGGDGYIGWSLGIQRAFNTNDDIFLVDSYKKRNYQKTLDISELYTTPLLSEKIYLYELITGKHNLKSLSINVANGKSVDSLIDSYKPDVILNAAHQPSAPLSMKSPQYARETLQNNEMSCLNVLWAVHNHCPNSLVINIYIYEYSSNIYGTPLKYNKSLIELRIIKIITGVSKKILDDKKIISELEMLRKILYDRYLKKVIGFMESVVK